MRGGRGTTGQKRQEAEKLAYDAYETIQHVRLLTLAVH